MKPSHSYKDSVVEWLGEIPNHWDGNRSKYVFSEIVDKTEDGEGDLLSVSEYYGVAKRKDKVAEGDWVSRAETLEGYKKCYKHDLIMNIMLAWKKAMGISAYDGLVSPAYGVYRFIQDSHSMYFHHLLRTDLYATEYKKHSTGVIESRLRLYSDRFFNIPLLLPPLPEQQAIAKFLDSKTQTIDRVISIKEKQILHLKELRTAIINQAVTKGLDPNVPMKDSGVEWLGEIPEHWEVKRIKFVSKLITKGTTPSTIGKGTVTDGNIRYLKAENISDSLVVGSPEFFIDDETNQLLERSQLQTGDILFVIAGATIGKTAILPSSFTPANTNQAIAFIRTKKGEILSFMHLWLQSDFIHRATWLDAVQSAQPNLSMENLGNFILPSPPKSEQQALANYLDQKTTQIDESIEANQKQIDNLKEYRTALIREVVTGKIDVRERS